MSIIIFIIILLVLVLVHEAGHFFTAKGFGIRVDEFGFGFPPKLFGIKKGETEYTFNALPIGGFVKIYGQGVDETEVLKGNFKTEEKKEDKDIGRSFIDKPRWQQAIVLFAGIFANFLLAWILLSIGFMSGLPTSVGSEPKVSALTDIHLVVVSVSAKSPAEISGLKTGDKIISVNSGKDSILEINPDTFKTFITSHGNKEVDISYTRGQDKALYTAKATPTADKVGAKPMIGISMDEIGTAKLSFFQSLWEGMKLDWSITEGTVVGLYTLIASSIHGHGSMSDVTGPVGMVGIVGDAYHFGFVYLLSFMALISINLAIINLIPFPALDGGRLLFLLIEKIKGSRLNPKFANTANTVGFVILIALMLLVTLHDVIKLF